MVNQSGAYIDQTGSSKKISNAADLGHLKSCRAWADCVVTSGKTALAEGYRPLKSAQLVIFTRRQASDFDPELKEQGVRFLSGDLADVLGALELEYSNILLEFGPAVLSDALRLQLVDELQLSVTGSTANYTPEVLSKLPLSLAGYRADTHLTGDDLVIQSFKPSQ